MALVIDPATGNTIDDETGEVVATGKYDPVANGDLARWYELNQQQKEIKDVEMSLRKKIVVALFPDIWEGTKSQLLSDGSATVKAVGKVNRKLDMAELTNMREFFADNDILVDELVEWKPELKLSAYRDLSDAQRHVFDRVLTITPGSPTLEVVPKKVKK